MNYYTLDNLIEALEGFAKDHPELRNQPVKLSVRTGITYRSDKQARIVAMGTHRNGHDGGGWKPLEMAVRFVESE